MKVVIQIAGNMQDSVVVEIAVENLFVLKHGCFILGIQISEQIQVLGFFPFMECIFKFD